MSRYYALFFTLFLACSPQPTQATLKNFLKKAGATVAINTPHYAFAALPTIIYRQVLANNDQIKAYKQKKLGTEPANAAFQQLIRNSFAKAGVPNTKLDVLNLYRLPSELATDWGNKHISSFAYNNDFYINEEYYSTLSQDQQEALLVVAGLEIKRHSNTILLGAACVLPLITELTSFILRNTFFRNIWRDIQRDPGLTFALSLYTGFYFKLLVNLILIGAHKHSHNKRILSEAVSIVGTSEPLKQYYNNVYLQTRDISYLNNFNYLNTLN